MSEKICGIYKITIFPTDKCYIGQSVNIYNRYKEHLYSSKDTTKSNDRDLPIHRAIRKYGVENICLEILERCAKKKLNERKRYWIAYYKSNEKQYRYNLAKGGQDSFGLSGERHSQAKLTQAQVDNIIKELSDNKKTLRQIAVEFHVSSATITNINVGKNWKKAELSYSIRKNASQSNIVKKAITDKRRACSDEMVYEIRKMYSTMCSLQKIYDAFSEIPPRTINGIIYRKGTCYDEVPFFDRKTQQWS